MKLSPTQRSFGAAALMAVMFTSLSFAPGQVSKSATYAGAEDIPRTWDDAAMGVASEIPMASPAGSPRAVSAEYYYKIPVRIIYEQYPVYAPGREPAGYMDHLRQLDPVILWDDGAHHPKLQTKED